MGLKILAPAKINLGLEIFKKNIDGYHEVDMIMQSISLCDEISIDFCKTQGIEVTSDKKINCSPKENIAYRAAQKFFDCNKIRDKGIKIKIKKNIPMCAGLAGGSADGAGVIFGLNKMFGTNLKISEMCEIGSKIGSDIPFCMVGGAAIAKGTGTDLTAIDPIENCEVLIIKPKFSFSTAESYSRFDNMKIKENHSMLLLRNALKSHSLSDICSNLFNRFEYVIDKPEIFEIKNKLKKFGALGSLMTGSGSAVYGIFDDESKAKFCLETLRDTYEFASLAGPLCHGVFFA